MTIINYTQDQLGWPPERCEERVKMEEARLIPIGVFDMLAGLGWNLKGARLLDVGAGQGGAVVEAFTRGAECYGIEPGDEFRTIAKMRMKTAGGDADQIVDAGGEAMPFPDAFFDYVVSLQVLEHVRDPLPVMREIFRVLKRGGQCYISCENYLSFREQHYRVPWFPMLPKGIGSLYLRAIGRNPSFLRRYVYYTTYPQIWSLACRIGFANLTYDVQLRRLGNRESIRRRSVRVAMMLLQRFPARMRDRLCLFLLHLNAFWRVGVCVRLAKP